MSPKRPHTGFTLVELLAVVSIVGVLAAVAYPSYQKRLYAGRRIDAWGALMKEAKLQERYAVFNRGCYGPTGKPLGTAVSDSGYYLISIETSTPANNTDCGDARPTFTITAQVNPKSQNSKDPKQKGPQVGDDTCEKMMLDNGGRRSSVDIHGKDTTGSC